MKNQILTKIAHLLENEINGVKVKMRRKNTFETLECFEK
jgi:hypothetical protein